MIEPFVLEGPGVRLEPLDLGHVEALAAAAAADRSTYGFTWVPDGLDETRRYILGALELQATGRSLPFAVRRRVDDLVVGATRFLDLEVFATPAPWPPGIGTGPEPSADQPPSVAEIGSTWYEAAAQRSGVNAEAKLLLLTHAFEVWGALRVTFKTDARNQASRGAIERLGARFEGIRRAHTVASDGTIRDSAYYSITTPEWPGVRDGLQGRLGLL